MVNRILCLPITWSKDLGGPWTYVHYGHVIPLGIPDGWHMYHKEQVMSLFFFFIATWAIVMAQCLHDEYDESTTRSGHLLPTFLLSFFII